MKFDEKFLFQSQIDIFLTKLNRPVAKIHDFQDIEIVRILANPKHSTELSSSDWIKRSLK
jgi:hypothetical protein